MERLCLNDKTARKKLGTAAAKKLKQVLSFIEAQPCGLDLLQAPLFGIHSLRGTREGCLSLKLSDKMRLVFCSAMDPCPLTPEGSTDWIKVTTILIVEIGDYHDDIH